MNYVGDILMKGKDEVLRKHFKKQLENATHEEIVSALSYSMVRAVNLEMVIMVLLEKKIIKKGDFDKLYSKVEKKIKNDTKI